MKKNILIFLLLLSAFLPAQNRDSLMLFGLNSPSEESHPIISPDGQKMYFVRENHDLNIGSANKKDIWVTSKNADGNWNLAVNLGLPINNDDHNSLLGISLDGSTLYFTSGRQIFFSQKKGRVWQTPKMLNLPFKTLEPFEGYVSLNEQIILLSLENEKVIGKKDLFAFIKNEKEKWSEAINLGEVINTSQTENNAFLSADNKTLYFCSDGKKGFGGLDWYVSNRLDDSWQRWSEPQNLGEKVNTPQDDHFLSFTFDGKEAYTTRKTRRSNDIVNIKNYQFAAIESMVLIKGKIAWADGKNQNNIPLFWQPFHQEKQKNNFQANGDGNFQVLLSDDVAFGFYGQDKNYYSTMGYINFNEIPLKRLDFDAFFATKNKKDSLNQHRADALIIRVGQLNQEITQLSEQGFTSKKKQINDNLTTPKDDFSTDRDLEKLKNKFEKKEKNNTLFSNSPIAKAASIEDEILSPSASIETKSAIRDLFSQYQFIKKTDKNPKTSVSQNEENPLEDRAAIDDLAAIEGVSEKKQFADFQALSLKITQDITDEILPDIKQALFKDVINNWANWNFLKLSQEEERILLRFLPEKKKTFLKESNNFIKNQNLNDNFNKRKNKYEPIERKLYETLLPQVTNDLLTTQKELIAAEMDWKFNFSLKNALRSEYQEELSKRIASQLKSEKVNIKNATYSPKGYKQVHHESNKNIQLTFFPLKENQVIPLNSIFFKENSAQLLPESKWEILRLADLLKERKAMFIAIQVHTHSDIGFEVGQNLSTLRATIIREELAKLGVPADRITTNGFGKFAPLRPNDSAESRFENQRIEFKILNL